MDANLQTKKVFSVSLAIVAILAIHYLIINFYIFLAFSIYRVVVGSAITAEAARQFVASQTSIAVIVAGIGAFVLYALHFNARKQSLFVMARFKKFTPLQGVLAFTAGLGAVFMSGLIVQGVAFVFPEAYARFVDMVESLEMGGTIPLMIAVVLIAPIIEEVMFRGLIFDILERKYALMTTVIVQGVLFGAYHMNIIQGSYALVLGIILGLALIWTGSIWIPILLHFGNNLMSTVLGLDSVSHWIEDNEMMAGAFVMVMLLVVFPLSLYGLYRTRIPFVQRSAPRGDAGQLHEHPLNREDLFLKTNIDELLDREE